MSTGLPYEPVPDGPIWLNLAIIPAGALTYRSAVVDTPAGRLPAVVFDFQGADGSPLDPIMLILTPAAMRQIGDEFRKAAHHAVEVAAA